MDTECGLQTNCKHPQFKSTPIMAHVHNFNRLVPQTVERARFMNGAESLELTNTNNSARSTSQHSGLPFAPTMLPFSVIGEPQPYSNQPCQQAAWQCTTNCQTTVVGYLTRVKTHHATPDTDELA
ncbi:hypothetical protein CY34DRAFT_813429, partial [Suillus luteus UH-Slu-Lm8-n1]